MNTLENSIPFFDRNLVQLSVSIVLVTLFLIVRLVLLKLIKRRAKKHEMHYSREAYVRKLIDIALLLLFVSIIGMIWEISLKGLSIYFASVFTVIGVGLFATWSVLSNLTASVILFFFFPYRIGEKMKIVDKDMAVEGLVIDITLFYIKIKTEEGQIISYPNNLAIQKPIQQS
ncbi:MAG: mechanosensitive ion channel family protein [Cytophagales bacterium]|nr:mechanosensitive ion channel family protein [Cytophagales bacterium]